MTFYEKQLQKTNQKEFRIKNVIKRKGNKLFVKWKGYDNSFNSWIDEIHSEVLEELLMLKLICLIMEQNVILKM